MKYILKFQSLEYGLLKENYEDITKFLSFTGVFP